MGEGLLHYVTWPGRAGLPALVLLHGSGGNETSLLGFARAAATGHPLVAVRGRLPWEGGYAHFRRNPDRTLDEADLARGAIAVCELLGQLHAGGQQPPILLGYSNGAIVAAAALLRAPGLSTGAILLRPLSPHPGQAFPPLGGYRVLLVAGATDARRAAADAPQLAAQFRAAGARVTACAHPGGHATSGADEVHVRDWLRRQARG
ncbi:alpha/beta hydrolase [Falsiroseomonas sp. E2-1-a20]|uniref:alpha/beta hydrolase n=1 Tax=Falsiroseomonas sp. E2-1-a20 TaxID=3239300 RepID=UPI003F2D79E1